MISPAILISGVAKYSLGEAIVSVFRSHYTDSPIVVIDKDPSYSRDAVDNMHHIAADLNPFSRCSSYKQLATVLEDNIRLAKVELGFPGVGTLVLNAGVYDCGPLTDIGLESRRDLIGINVCGKVELLHAVLCLNRELGFKSSDELTLVDVGSLHGLAPAPDRSLYGATKAMALELCASLSLAREVSRVLHLAPGAIDTHMLHRNHWVSKEHGPADFIEQVRSQDGPVYEQAFVNGDDTAFAALAAKQPNPSELLDVFRRYKKRRQEQFSSDTGVLDPTEVARSLSAILDDESSSGVYVVTAPKGKIRVRNLPFAEMSRALCP